VVLVLYAAAVYLARLPAFSLREVRVDGELKHVTRGEVETIVRRELKGGFFTVNLAATRAAFERLPWVRGASVRRQWPARLDVALEEHVPFARWAGQSRLPGAVNPVALVNTHGEVFHAAHEGDLPVFIGPEGAAREMAIQYRYFHRALGTIGETPVQVRVTTRRAWQIKLASGPVLELGRESIEARLHRFVALHDRTVGRLGQAVDTVDLRYANGFAVRIPELRHEKFEPKRGRRAG
jgi:cell division protein FtsQ